MINNKGQALIEFIMIIPVLMLFVLGIFDIGNVIYKKYQLENDLDYIVDLYETNQITEINSYIKGKNITMNDQNNTDYTTITLIKNISFVTPGASKILGSTYKVSTSRTIKNES